MERSDDGLSERGGAVQHLEDALAASENDDVRYHIRQALQLLDIE